jgi:prepilin-type N-terminal cleavage/methylation domain-containing protein
VKNRAHAFTLVELLAALGIIAVLSVTLLAGVRKARSFSDRAATAQSLRSLGAAMQSYAADNDLSLPGPFYNAQSAFYSTKLQGALGTFLWSYLGSPEPTSQSQECKAINNPANLRARPVQDSPVYLIRPEITMSGGTTIKPFGARDSDGTVTQTPIKTPALSSYGLSKNWAAVDIDQKLSRVQGWDTSKYPKNPVLGNVRMALYFDWHVETIPVSQEP